MSEIESFIEKEAQAFFNEEYYRTLSLNVMRGILRRVADAAVQRERLLLCRAVVELNYCHSAENICQVESAEGLNIVEEGMKLLELKDLSEEQTDKYLRPRAYAARKGTPE